MVREREVPKQFGDLALELLLSLQVVRDSSRALETGSVHQILPLAGQLRALLLEKRRDAHALLLHFASAAGIETTLFVMPGPNEPLPAGLAEPTFRLAGFPFSISRTLHKQIEVQLDALADRELIRYGGQSYSIEALLKYYANRAGGAHYSKSIPESLAKLLSYESSGLRARNLVMQAFAQIGRVIYEFGRACVRKLTDLDLFLSIVISEPKQKSILLDASHPNTSARFTFYLDEQVRPTFQCSSIDGTTAVVRNGTALDAGRHIVRLSLRHDDNLHGQITLMVDASQATEACPVPLFLPNDVRSYCLRLNSNDDGQGNSQSAFALSEMLVYGGISAEDTERVIAYLAEQLADPERGTVYYGPGNSGHAAPGTTDLANCGAVYRKVGDLLEEGVAE